MTTHTALVLARNGLAKVVFGRPRLLFLTSNGGGVHVRFSVYEEAHWGKEEGRCLECNDHPRNSMPSKGTASIGSSSSSAAAAAASPS